MYSYTRIQTWIIRDVIMRSTTLVRVMSSIKGINIVLRAKCVFFCHNPIRDRRTSHWQNVDYNWPLRSAWNAHRAWSRQHHAEHHGWGLNKRRNSPMMLIVDCCLQLSRLTNRLLAGLQSISLVTARNTYSAPTYVFADLYKRRHLAIGNWNITFGLLHRIITPSRRRGKWLRMCREQFSSYSSVIK